MLRAHVNAAPSTADESSRARRPSWPWVAVPAAAAAAGIVAAVNLNEQLRWERNRHWEDAKEIANLSSELYGVRQELARDQELVAALARGEAQVIALAPAGAGRTGTGHVIWNEKAGTWTLLASGLEALGRDQVYELWFTKSGATLRSAVRFEPGPDGIVRQTIPVPADLPQVDGAAVTVEPKTKDDPRPSGTFVIEGKVRG